jgi:hypothetical protein
MPDVNEGLPRHLAKFNCHHPINLMHHDPLPRLRAGVKTDILNSAEFTRRLCQSSPPRNEKLSHEASSDSSLP